MECASPQQRDCLPGTRERLAQQRPGLDRLHFREQRLQRRCGPCDGRGNRLLDDGEAIGQHAMAGMCLRPGQQGLAYAGRCIQPLLVEQGDGRGRGIGTFNRRVPQLTAEEQIVGGAASHRDAQPVAIKVCNHSDEVEDADFAALHAHGFNDEDIWDIAAITAFFGLSNRMASFSGMMPNPEFYLMGRVARQK